MISRRLRRVPLRSFHCVGIAINRQKNDFIVGIANVHCTKVSFSSSICKTAKINSGGSVASEVVSFPATSPGNEIKEQPILLDAKEHAVGYLNRILNARVYEAAIETELQHAKNLSTVS